MAAQGPQSVMLLGRLGAAPATKRRGPGLSEIAIPEEPAEGDATPFRVKNTFIDPLVKRTPSLEDFFSEREVQTCPGGQIGRLESLFQEAEAADLAAAPGGATVGQLTPEGFAAVLRRGLRAQEEANHLPTTPRLASPQSVVPAEGGGAGCWDRTASADSSRPTAQGRQAGADRLAPTGPPEPLWPAALLPDVGLRLPPDLPEFVWPAAAGPRASPWAPPAPAPPPQPPQDRPCAYVTASGALAAGGFCRAAPGLHQPAPLPTAVPRVAAMPAHPSTAPPLVVAAPAPLPPPQAAPGTQAVPAPPSGPAPGSAELPSVGSALHEVGQCKPCAFLGAKSCKNGVVCSFCHLCEPGEMKRRSKEKHTGRQASAAAPAARAAARAAAPPPAAR